jgi:hypothetical protein
MSQLKKAWGLNKKIMNPIDKKKKNLLHFCYVIEGQDSIPLMEFLNKMSLPQKSLGLASIPHMRDIYAVFYDDKVIYNGIMHSESSMEVTLSSIPQAEKPIAILYFNRDGFSTYCKDYREYWDWVEKRNEIRFQNTIKHGKNYDAKNMVHVFRLLYMAEDIGRLGQITVRQSNRDLLLQIKNGDFYYEELVQKAQQRLKEIENIYQFSSLPEKPNLAEITHLLIEIRKSFYQ